ncbi:ABC transporter ATP-binding protein [Corynebacterium mayonis]|uniref:ABC transporter ATP-binding protein n=1 Tax=Corynebacterium mayonis TaxID=3062461 RepID=UPI0031400E86
MAKTVVSARGLGYHHATRKTPAFTGVDFDVAAGERVLITGDSGSGKSTLVSVIAGLAADGEDGRRLGTIEVDGSVGMVMQDPEAQTILTRVGDDVAFGAENLGVPRDEIWQRVREALDAVGLDVPLEHNTSKLSGGQKQRLALAGVIAMGASIIVLDEPTANLDPQGRADIIGAVDQVCRRTGASLIVVEHRPKPWAGIVDAFYRLDSEGLHLVSVMDLPGAPELPPARKVPVGTQLAVRTSELELVWGPSRSVKVPEGFSTVITGANGTGKTTLALALAGLTKTKRGQVEYSQAVRQGLAGAPLTWKSKQLAQRIGYVFQDPEHQFVTSTVEAEMELSGAPKERVDSLLQRLRLDHLRRANPFTLSGGEKRRLSVATALVNAPRLLFLDEPTFGQDDRTFVELVGLIRELTDDGVTVVSITHDEAFIASLGDHQEVLG